MLSVIVKPIVRSKGDMEAKVTKYILKPLGILLLVWLVVLLLISIAGFTVTIWNMFLMTLKASYGC